MFSPPPPKPSKDYTFNKYHAYGRKSFPLPVRLQEERDEIEKNEGIIIPSDEVIMNKILEAHLLEDISQDDYTKMMILIDNLLENSPYLTPRPGSGIFEDNIDLSDAQKNPGLFSSLDLVKQKMQKIKHDILDAELQASYIEKGFDSTKIWLSSIYQKMNHRVDEQVDDFLDWLYTASDHSQDPSRKIPYNYFTFQSDQTHDLQHGNSLRLLKDQKNNLSSATSLNLLSENSRSKTDEAIAGDSFPHPHNPISVNSNIPNTSANPLMPNSSGTPIITESELADAKLKLAHQTGQKLGIDNEDFNRALKMMKRRMSRSATRQRPRIEMIKSLAVPPFILPLPSYSKDLIPSQPEYQDRSLTALDVVKDYDLNGQTALVTGGYSGIGAEVTRALASAGALVVLPCIDPWRCDFFAQSIRNQTGNPDVYCEQVDLGELSSIMKFWNRLITTNTVPNLVIHSAGVLKPLLPLNTHVGQVNRTIGINYLGPVILNEYLLPLVSTSDQENCRIIMVTDSQHRWASMNQSDISAENIAKTSGYQAYYLSKLGNIINTRYLANKLYASGIDHVTVNAIDPGPTWGTNLCNRTFFPWLKRHFGPWLNNTFVSQWLSFNVWSPAQAAAPIVRLALDPKLQNITGRYFERFDESVPSKEAQSQLFISSFMKATMKLTNDIFQHWVGILSHKHLKQTEKGARPQMEERSRQEAKHRLNAEENLRQLIGVKRPSYQFSDSVQFLEPPPPQEYLGSRALGAGTREAPVIGEELAKIFHDIPDTHPGEIQRLETYRKLHVPEEKLSSEEMTEQVKKRSIAQLEFNRLKGEILTTRTRRYQQSSISPLDTSPGLISDKATMDDQVVGQGKGNQILPLRFKNQLNPTQRDIKMADASLWEKIKHFVSEFGAL